jgi:hypothetical protein
MVFALSAFKAFSKHNHPIGSDLSQVAFVKELRNGAECNACTGYKLDILAQQTNPDSLAR